MSEMFQGFQSLKPGRQISFLGYLASAFAGWAALEIALAIPFFVIPHGPNFAPEIGPAATFVVFSLAFTSGYLALFVVMAVPLRLLVVRTEGSIAKRLLPLASGVAFALVSGVFVWFESSARNVEASAMLFAIAGIACMAVMQVAAK
jgi:hypothetical protein